MCFVYKSLIKFSFLKINVNLLSLGLLRWDKIQNMIEFGQFRLGLYYKLYFF